MGQLFSHHDTKHSHKTATISDTDRAVLSLKTQRKRLEDQQKLLEQRIDRYAAVARELVREAKKDRALLALRKKKMSENQLAQLSQLLLNIEGMLGSMELARQQNKMFAVLKQGNEALKQLQSQVALEDVQQLMDDTADAKAYQDEMNAVLAQSLTGEDDAAAAAELDEMETLQMAQMVADMPRAPATPQVAQKVEQPAAVAAAAEQPAAEEEAEEEEAEEEPRQREGPMAA